MLISLLLYMAVYLLVYPVGIGFMVRLVRRGPDDTPDTPPVESGRPAAPVNALPPTGGR